MSPKLRAALDAIGPEPKRAPAGVSQERIDYLRKRAMRAEAQRDALLVALRELGHERSCLEDMHEFGEKCVCGYSELLAKCGDAP